MGMLECATNITDEKKHVTSVIRQRNVQSINKLLTRKIYYMTLFRSKTNRKGGDGTPNDKPPNGPD